MHMIRTAIAGILALFVASAAIAQTFPTVASQSVIGRLGVPGTTGPSQAIPFATLSAQLFSLVPSQLYDVSHYGVLPGNTATANTAAIGAVEALTGAPRPMYVLPGHYDTNFTPYQVTNQKYLGPGQLKMSGFAQAAQRVFILNPQPIASTNRAQMFDGLCAYQFDCQYSYVGSGATATQAGGYQNFIELSPNVRVSESVAGFNSGTAGVGPNRSGQFQNYKAAYFGGGGDYTIDSYYGEMFGGCPIGATHFLACPALAIHNGGVGAGSSAANGGYLQGKEIIFTDRADAAMTAINDVINMVRNNAGNTLGQVWGGYRIQSGGTQPIEFGYTISGKVKSAFDVTMTDLGANKTAVALKASDRIYLAATATADSAGAKWYADTPGTEWITSAGNAIGLTALGYQSLTVSSAPSSVNGLQVIARATTVAPQIAAVGSDTNVGVQIVPKGSGQVTISNSGGVITVPSATATLATRSDATTVNGTPCTLTGSCTVAAGAGTLTGATLAAGVTASSLTSVGTITTGIWNAGAVTSSSTLKSGVSAVGSLPACNAGAEGTRSGVTDASATTFLSIVAGGGANHVPVYCNGANWVIGG